MSRVIPITVTRSSGSRSSSDGVPCTRAIDSEAPRPEVPPRSAVAPTRSLTLTRFPHAPDHPIRRARPSFRPARRAGRRAGEAPGGPVPRPGRRRRVEAETRQALTNIKKLLEANGSSMDHVVKCLVMLADIGEWAKMNGVYVTFFPNHRPARSAFGATGLALGGRLEIECIATVR